jgi:hypothetical protein
MRTPDEETDVEVRLDRDYDGPQLSTETVPAGTWVERLDASPRLDPWHGDRWRAHVHFSVTHQGRSLGYLGG